MAGRHFGNRGGESPRDEVVQRGGINVTSLNLRTSACFVLKMMLPVNA